MVETHLPTLPDDQTAAVQDLLRYAPSTPHLNPHGLVIRDGGTGSGRGIYASRPLSSGTVLEISPVLLFPPAEYEAHGRWTQLDGYTFVWKRTQVGSIMALALGLGSLFNHSTSPNVNYRLDHEGQCISYTLMRNVDEGEELCISYGVGRMWWEPPEGEEEKVKRRQREGDEEDEYRRMAGVGAEGYISSDDEEEREDGKANSRITKIQPRAVAATIPPTQHRNGIDVHAQPGSSRQADATADTNKAKPSYPPLYRMTSARDPRTLPLETTAAWIVDISPRNSSAAVKYLQKHATLLQCRDDGLFSTRHLRSFKTEKRRNAQTGKDETLIRFLVCLRDAMPEREEVVKLLRLAPNQAFAPPFEQEGSNGKGEPEPYLFDVPAAAAPTKARLLEWTAVWPCIVRSGGFSPNAGGPTAPPGTTSVGVVDRAEEERLWTADDGRLRWARNRFRRVVALAKAAKERGEVPVAVHVTHPFEESSKWGNGWNEREESDWSRLPRDASIASRRQDTAGAVVVGRSMQQNGAPTSPFGANIVEVDAVDSRISLRNPLKHAAVQCVAKVAELRAQDRQTAATAMASNQSSSSSPSSAAAAGTVAVATTTAAATSNGQDYLLTGLVLFTTHEPCVYCSMALVHSRVKAVYFLLPSPGRGGCCGAQLKEAARCAGGQDGGVYAIQEQRGLNHAFQVWRWMDKDLAHAENDASERGRWSLDEIREDLELDKLDP